MSVNHNRKFPHLFDVAYPDYLKNPYRYYAEVQDQCPVYKTPYGVYLLTKYKDIQYALSSKNFIKEYWKPLKDIYGEGCFKESGFSLISQWMINKNPPAHTDIRRLLTLALSSKKIAYLHDITHKIASELIKNFIAKGVVDLASDFAFKLPALVICQLLGIPEEDHEFLFNTASLPNVLMDPIYLSRSILDKANQSVNELNLYFKDLCNSRKNKLGDDLISLLLQARQDSGLNLSDEDLISNVFFLFGAGHETTMNLILNGFYSLMLYPEQLYLLRENFNLMPNAIMEILRFEAPVQVASPSVAESDIEIGGILIKKNEVIMPILGAACRDPEEYDDPHQFLINRTHKGTLAFGYGIHLCLGAQLAKIEGAIALECLLNQLPAHTSIVDLHNPKWKQVISVRGLQSLTVEW